ncbi:AAA family ATPase [Leptospira sp. 201903075]|uniref:AAA family ATPase n=1 Tax=Leptospira chreensis TaxID=2810035 RepID=UPI001966A6A8|nr:AAA family ATPase [Leptospira chreensis]MBM9590887.1 AAA family ATPase [Leptospira chreensis]
MIKKIKYIKNLAVFKDFQWDSLVKSKNGNICEFKKINIIYGRNYSGKTTISRIVRSLETGSLSEKYENPEFEIEFNNQDKVTLQSLTSHGKDIRVFNDDFVRENLKFIYDPNEDIESFAILGSDNNLIEKEIEKLKNELGSKEEGQETALYKEQKEAIAATTKEANTYKSAQTSLDEKIKNKAIDRNIGIKYKSERFGDQNYSTNKLENDIQTILKDDFQPISDEKVKELDKLLAENPNPPISPFTIPILSFNSLADKAKSLIEKEIAGSDKIAEFVNDAILHRWVNEGRTLHQEKKNNCLFCDNIISQERWEKLNKHFDKESEQLEKDLDELINEIENEIIQINYNPQKTQFYSEFHERFDEILTEYKQIEIQYSSNLNNITTQLTARKKSLLKSKSYIDQKDVSNDLKVSYEKFEVLRKESNEYTNKLNSRQQEAKQKLKLKEVYDFVLTINYKDEKNNIEILKSKVKEKEDIKNNILIKVKEKEELIEANKRLLNDEEEGAKNVNKYLNDFFGHRFLSLEAISDEEDGDEKEKEIRFDLKRDGKKAHHLSEGECSLISFCYFIAKLEDIKTKGQKPIIWIDDPISSLDGNHIFFLYSLIKSEIIEKGSFEQIFISTHSLNFLKYLKRLTGGAIGINGKLQSYERGFFLVNREDKISKILMMPKYLKEYITEFNFLFNQIYNCSLIDEVTDKNYTTFYNFGNNARKFLEIYLFYKYPDETEEFEKLKKFFGTQSIPAILTERVNNEYSHLSANFERGAVPIDAPEMKAAAQLLIQRIKVIDNDQYIALMNSIKE